MIFMGDCNVEPNEATMFKLCQVYNMSNFFRYYTCNKNPDNLSCIDLILTNKPKSFLRSALIEKRLSYFHKMTLAIMETYFMKQIPNIIEYHDFEKFSNDLFRKDIQKILRPEDIFQNDQIHTIMCNIFNRQTPLKKGIFQLIRLLL